MLRRSFRRLSQHQHQQQQNCSYAVLGLKKETATQKDVREAYLRLSKQHHPDVNPSTDSTARFQAVSAAYAEIVESARQPNESEQRAQQANDQPHQQTEQHAQQAPKRDEPRRNPFADLRDVDEIVATLQRLTSNLVGARTEQTLLLLTALQQLHRAVCVSSPAHMDGCMRLLDVFDPQSAGVYCVIAQHYEHIAEAESDVKFDDRLLNAERAAEAMSKLLDRAALCGEEQDVMLGTAVRRCIFHAAAVPTMHRF